MWHSLPALVTTDLICVTAGVAHHPQTESPVSAVETHGPVDQVKHHEHDREHHQEHVINTRPETLII